MADTPVSRSFPQSHAGPDTESAPHPEPGQRRGRAAVPWPMSHVPNARDKLKAGGPNSLPRREQQTGRILPSDGAQLYALVNKVHVCDRNKHQNRTFIHSRFGSFHKTQTGTACSRRPIQFLQHRSRALTAEVWAQGRGYLARSPKQHGAGGVPWVLLDP